MKIGRLLKQIRIFHDLKQADICKQLDISPSHLSQVENGIKKPSMDILKKYEKAFDVKVSIMLLFVDNWEQRDLLKSKLRNIITESTLKFLEFITR